MAVRYYLHYMLWECERHWADASNGVTNYKTLLDQIRHCRKPGELVGLVTFNYDRMIEDAMATVGRVIRALPDYICDDNYQLFKVHGSVHWARETSMSVSDREVGVWQAAAEAVEKAPQLQMTETFRIVDEHPIGKAGDALLCPAIAIPVEAKSAFECPKSHLDALTILLPKVTKILVIGWRAAESHFLELLKRDMKHRPRGMVVAGTREAGQETIRNLLQGGIEGDYEVASAGFTEFVKGREGDNFLKS